MRAAKIPQPPGSFLTPDGKLPPFAQRRLDYLLEKNREEGLGKGEAAELREMLEYIDLKSIELLGGKPARRIAKKRTVKNASNN